MSTQAMGGTSLGLLVRIVGIVALAVSAGCGDGGGGITTPGTGDPAPTVLSTTPGSNISGIKINTSLNVTFSENIDPLTVSPGSFMLLGPGNIQSGGTTTVHGAIATFTPTSYLSTGTTYTAVITTATRDWSGTHLAQNYSWSFTTSTSSDLISPTVVAISPAANATEVKVYSVITITFSEPMDPLTVNAGSFTVRDGNHVYLDGIVSVHDATAAFIPANGLSPKTTYTAFISSDATDTAGNHLQSTYYWDFSTGFANSELLASYQTFTTGAWPTAVAIGDVNNDGRNDVVLTTGYSNNSDPTYAYKLFVFLQDAGGRLGTAATYATTASYGNDPISIAIGDINSDGKNEVVVGIAAKKIEVYAQDGSGGLVSSASLTSPSYASIMRIADLNHDGRLDVVGLGNSLEIFLQNTFGSLDAPVAYSVSHGGGDDLDVGDINDDGLNDIIVMSGQGYAYPNIGILTQKADGTFNGAVYYSLGGNRIASGVAVGDVNGGSLNDIVVTSGGIAVFLQNAAGTLDPAIDYPGSGCRPRIADMDQDGRNDVIVVTPGSMKVGIYLQASNGAFLSEEFYTNAYGNINSLQPLAVGDVNSDGLNDVITLDTYRGLVVLYHQ